MFHFITQVVEIVAVEITEIIQLQIGTQMDEVKILAPIVFQFLIHPELHAGILGADSVLRDIGSDELGDDIPLFVRFPVVINSIDIRNTVKIRAIHLGGHEAHIMSAEIPCQAQSIKITTHIIRFGGSKNAVI